MGVMGEGEELVRAGLKPVPTKYGLVLNLPLPTTHYQLYD
jgi:hypothetical protein